MEKNIVQDVHSILENRGGIKMKFAQIRVPAETAKKMKKRTIQLGLKDYKAYQNACEIWLKIK